jgi:tetratricopeptide (TPR) repeat protein
MSETRSSGIFRLTAMGCILAALAVPAFATQGLEPKSGGEFNRALRLFEAGDYAGAENILRPLEKANPRNFDVQHMLGIVLDLAGKPEAAGEHFKKAVALNPSFAPARVNLATNLVRTGKIELAIAEFRQALKFDPASPTANFNLGTIFLRRKNYREALPLLEKAYRLQPRVYENGYHLALCLFLSGDYRRTQDVLNALRPVPPQRLEFHLITAMNRKAMGQEEEARRSLQEILPALSARPELHEQVSLLLFSQGMFREAIPILEAARKQLPAVESPLAALAHAEFQTGDLVKAEEYARQALAVRESAEAHLLLADILEASSRFIEAVGHYQKAANLSPSEKTFLALGYEFLTHWNWNEAQTVFELATAKFKTSWRLQIGKGVAMLGQNDGEKATRSFLQALSLSPSEPHGYDLLAESFAEANESFDAAVTRFQDYYRANPGNPMAAYYKVLAAWRESVRSASPFSFEENIGLIETAADSMPGFYPAQFLRGEIHYSRQEWAKAVEFFEKAAKLDARSFEVHYRLGLSLQRLGKGEQSRAELQIYQELKEKQNEAMADKIARTVKFLVEEPAKN